MVFGQQQQQQQQGGFGQGGGGFGRGHAAAGWGNKGQQQGGFGQQSGGAQGGMVFGKRAQGPSGDMRAPSPGRGAGGRAGGRQGRGGGAGSGSFGGGTAEAGGGWRDTGGGRGRGRLVGGRGQQSQQYNQPPQQQYNQAPRQQQQRQPFSQQQRGPNQQQQQQAKSSPSIMSRLGSVFGFTSSGKQQGSQDMQGSGAAAAAAAAGAGGYDAAAGGRGRGRGRGARGRSGFTEQWQQGGPQQQQGDWDLQQQQGRGRGQAGRGRGGRGGWQQQQQPQQQQWGQAAQPAAIVSGRGGGRDRGRGGGRGGNQVWSRQQGQQWGGQQQKQQYLGGQEADMGDAVAEGWEDAAAADGGDGFEEQPRDAGGDYEGDDMDMQDYDMDEAYEEEWDGEEGDQEAAAEDGADVAGYAADYIAADAGGGFFGQQQQQQQQKQQPAQALFGVPAAAPAAAPKPQPALVTRAPIPSPAAAPAQAAAVRAPRAAPPPRAAVRAAVAAAAAAADVPAREYCYSVPAAHAPGSTAASYDRMAPNSVTLTAAQPRGQLKPRTRGAKQPQCTEMCPADERDQRTVERQLHPYERVEGEYATAPQLAVKKYQRSHAGEETDNSALRTWPALCKTLAHLRSILATLGAADWSSDRQAVFDLLEAHRFLWDRYRALRKDITQTELPQLGPAELYWVVCANEEMARFMILADALLAAKDKVNKDAKEAAAAASGKPKVAGSPTPRITFDLEGFREAQLAADAEADAAGGNFEPDPYDGHLNHQELTKTLLDLSSLYREAARIGLPAPNEAEFMAYYLILSRGTYGRYKASTSNVVRLLTAMSKQALVSPHVQFALAVSSCLMTTNWVRLMELLEGAPLLLAATAQVYVPGMRSKALVHLMRNGAPAQVTGPDGQRKVVKQLSLDHYAHLLRFDDAKQAKEFILLHQATCPGLSVTTSSAGEQVIQLAQPVGALQVLRTIPRHTLHWLVDKAAGMTLAQLIIAPCPAPDVQSLLGIAPAAAAAREEGGFGLAAPAVTAGAGLFGAAGAAPAAAMLGGAAAAAQTSSQAAKKQQQQPTQQQQQQQQQPLGGLFQFGGAGPAAAPAVATAATPGFGAAWGQQQQQQGQAAFGTGLGGRGSTDRLAAVLPPAAAVAGATAVFGGLMPTAAAATAQANVQAAQQLQQQQPVAAVGFGAAAAAFPLPQQQQQHQLGWGQQQPVLQFQQPAPTAQWQQPQQQQQQQQFVQQTQQQQHRPTRSTSAAAAAAAQAAADAALRAENAALKQKLADIEAEKQEQQQVEALSKELAAMRRRRIVRRWRASAATAKAARERVAAQLAASNATLGRRGEGLLSARRRQKTAAGADVQAVQGRDDLDMMVPQGKRQRALHHGDAAAAFDGALEDTSPLLVANIMAAALAAGAGGNGSSDGSSGSNVVYLPSMISSGLSSSGSADGGRYSSSSSSSSRRGVQCRAVPLTLRLVCVSGWGESDPRFAPPMVQRRVARWLRHKLADSRTPMLPGFNPGAKAAADGLGWGVQPKSQPEVRLVPLDGPVAHEQQQQQRSWAGVVKSNGLAQQQQQQQQRMVLQVCDGVELLTRRPASVPGPHESEVTVEVLDVAVSALAAAGGSNRGGHGSNGCGNGGSVSGVLAGACGVLLLVSGPDGKELQGAVKRLGLLLEHWPAAVPAPLTVLACSGPSTHSDIQVQLAVHMSRLPGYLQARTGSARVVCLGPGGQHPDAALQQALCQAAESPLLPRLHQVQASALLQALTVLELRAKLAAADAVAAAAAAAGGGKDGSMRAAVPDVLSAFVEAHNTGLLSLGNCLQAQLDSTAAAWGYPPSSYSSSSSSSSSNSSVWAAAEQVLHGAASLQLPPPTPLQDFHEQQQQQQQQHQVAAGAAALAQLTSYLDALSSGMSSSSNSSSNGRVSGVVASVATGLKAALTVKLLQQKQLLLPNPNSNSKSLQRQLHLVRVHSELLLERLQQQPLLQAMVTVDRSDLELIAAADEEQRQPGYWQQQQWLLLPAGDPDAQQQQQQQQSGYGGFALGWTDDSPLPWDSPREQVPLGWNAAGSFRHKGAGAAAQQQQQEQQQGDGDEGGDLDQSPEATHTVAKQQAAVAAELLARCRLKPWLR